MTEQKEGREFSWDDEIQEEQEFIVLPPGTYNFTIFNFERGRHEPKPSGKLPACPMANIQFQVLHEGKDVRIFDRLYLYSTMEGMISAFFKSIGLKKKGEKISMDWSKVPGSTGRFKLAVDTYNGNEKNVVKSYLPKDESKEAAAPAAENKPAGDSPWG